MNIKVVSLNIWKGILFEEIVAFLLQQDADVLMLQEVYNATDASLAPGLRALSELGKRLNYPYSDFSPALLDNRQEGKIPEGNAVFSKLPLTSFPLTFFAEPFNPDYVDIMENIPNAPQTMQHVELTTPVGPVHIYNIHGVWDLDGDNNSEKRQRMFSIIAEATAGKTRVVVAGDSNAKTSNPAMSRLDEHLRSVFGHELPTTFNIKRKDLKAFPGYATAPVDIMYVSPDVSVVSHSCPNVDVSDHLPLVVMLRI